jgi:hypothetical protein
MSNQGGVDQSGFITNVIYQGLLMNIITSIKELIDNSADAGAVTIEITIDNENNLFSIKDNGKGMDKIKLKRFITLCEKNTDTSVSGYYGIGAKAALITISDIKGMSKILTNITGTKGHQEIIINWKDITNEVGIKNPNVWTENVTYQNMDYEHVQLWKKQWGCTTGTYIETHSSEYIAIKLLKYEIETTYYHMINNGLKITINGGEPIGCVDITHYDEIKAHAKHISFNTFDYTERDNYSIYIHYTIRYLNGNYHIHVTDTNFKDIGETDYYYEKGIGAKGLELKKYELVTENIHNIDFDTDDVDIFDYKFCWVSKEMNTVDTKNQLDAQETSKQSDISGCYIVRNNRILSKPFSLPKVRVDQGNGRWRSAIIFNNNVNITNMIKPGINKSDIKKENIDKGFMEILRILTSGVINKCLTFQNTKPRCQSCHKLEESCECCKKCKKLACECCQYCGFNCMCCKKCKKLACECCQYCGLYGESCQCHITCGNCNHSRYQCLCCKNCMTLNCKTCNNPNCDEKICMHRCSCKQVNGHWKTIHNGSVYKDNAHEKYDMVYLVQQDEDWNTDTYKIGRTSQDINKSNQINRFKDANYKNFLKIILTIQVRDGREVETKIIKIFTETFTKIPGKQEHFSGDIDQMKRAFMLSVAEFM